MEWLPETIKAIANWFTRGDLYDRVKACETERDVFRLQLAEQKYELESYKELTLIGTMTVDQWGRIIDANAEMALITGYRDVDLLKMNLRDLLPYHLRDDHQRMFQEVVDGKRETRRTLIEGEIRASCGSGVGVWVKIARIPSASGYKWRADIIRRR